MADPFWKRDDRLADWPAHEPGKVWSAVFDGKDGKSLVQFERHDDRYLVYLLADSDVICPQAEPSDAVGTKRW